MAIEGVRQQIWELYQDLKAYRQQPQPAQVPVLTARFEALCAQRTRYPSINNALSEMREHQADLLRVLERPQVPLHNNASESDIRDYVKKRKSAAARGVTTGGSAGHVCQFEEDLPEVGHSVLGLLARPRSRPRQGATFGRHNLAARRGVHNWPSQRRAGLSNRDGTAGLREGSLLWVPSRGTRHTRCQVHLPGY